MRNRWIIAGVLAVIGLIWIAQGTSILPGSGGMYGDTRWAIAGIALIGVGILVGWTALRNRHPT